MKIGAVPDYGTPPAGRNRGGFHPPPSRLISPPTGAGRNKRGFDFCGLIQPGEIGATFPRGRFLAHWGREK